MCGEHPGADACGGRAGSYAAQDQVLLAGRRRACARRTSVCSAQGRRQHAGLRIPLQGAQSRTRVGGPELRAFAPGVCSALSTSLGGHRTLPIGPRSRCMEETLRGFPQGCSPGEAVLGTAGY